MITLSLEVCYADKAAIGDVGANGRYRKVGHFSARIWTFKKGGFWKGYTQSTTYVDKTMNIVSFGVMMKHTSAALSLAALGHDTRLTIFRLLVRAGKDGLNIGDVGQHLDMAASTLAYHLKTLVDAGLVTQERQGRQIINRVDFDVMHQTVSFLTAECCAGVKLTQEEAA